MARCQSCYGIIGVDCFNPEECAWITIRMQADKERERAIHEDRMFWKLFNQAVREYLRAALEAKEKECERRKARSCGCVVCMCEDEIQCQGCGAQDCDYHASMRKERDTALAEAERLRKQLDAEQDNTIEKLRDDY